MGVLEDLITEEGLIYKPYATAYFPPIEAVYGSGNPPPADSKNKLPTRDFPTAGGADGIGHAKHPLEIHHNPKLTPT